MYKLVSGLCGLLQYCTLYTVQYVIIQYCILYTVLTVETLVKITEICLYSYSTHTRDCMERCCYSHIPAVIRYTFCTVCRLYTQYVVLYCTALKCYIIQHMQHRYRQTHAEARVTYSSLVVPAYSSKIFVRTHARIVHCSSSLRNAVH